MRVPIKGYRYVRVTKRLLHVGGMRATSKQECDVGVPEIVETNVRQGSTLQERLEVPAGDGLVVVRRACAGGEYKPVISPLNTGPVNLLAGACGGS